MLALGEHDQPQAFERIIHLSNVRPGAFPVVRSFYYRSAEKLEAKKVMIVLMLWKAQLWCQNVKKIDVQEIRRPV